MRCPKCRFVSSNSKDLCPNCKTDLRPYKRSLGLPITNSRASVEELIHHEGLTNAPNSPTPTPKAEAVAPKPQTPQPGKSSGSWFRNLLGKSNDSQPTQGAENVAQNIEQKAVQNIPPTNPTQPPKGSPAMQAAKAELSQLEKPTPAPIKKGMTLDALDDFLDAAIPDTELSDGDFADENGFNPIAAAFDSKPTTPSSRAGAGSIQEIQSEMDARLDSLFATIQAAEISDSPLPPVIEEEEENLDVEASDISLADVVAELQNEIGKAADATSMVGEIDFDGQNAAASEVPSPSPTALHHSSAPVEVLPEEENPFNLDDELASFESALAELDQAPVAAAEPVTVQAAESAIEEVFPESSRELSSGTPLVAPSVLEFDEDDELFAQQIEDMLGEEDLDIQTVKVEKAERTESQPATLSFDDEDLEISFEIEGEDQEEDTKKPNNDDISAKMLTGLMSAFEDITATSQQRLITEESQEDSNEDILDSLTANLANVAHQQQAVAVTNSHPALADVQRVIASSTDNEALINNLLKIIGDIYHVDPASLRPVPAALSEEPLPPELAVVASLEKELQEQLSLLAAEGTDFLSEETSEGAYTLAAPPLTQDPEPIAAIEVSPEVAHLPPSSQEEPVVVDSPVQAEEELYADELAALEQSLMEVESSLPGSNPVQSSDEQFSQEPQLDVVSIEHEEREQLLNLDEVAASIPADISEPQPNEEELIASSEESPVIELTECDDELEQFAEPSIEDEADQAEFDPAQLIDSEDDLSIDLAQLVEEAAEQIEDTEVEPTPTDATGVFLISDLEEILKEVTAKIESAEPEPVVAAQEQSTSASATQSGDKLWEAALAELNDDESDDIEISAAEIEKFTNNEKTDVYFDLVDEELIAPEKKREFVEALPTSANAKVQTAELEQSFRTIAKDAKRVLEERQAVADNLVIHEIVINHASIMRRICGAAIDTFFTIAVSALLTLFVVLPQPLRATLLSGEIPGVMVLLPFVGPALAATLLTWFLINVMLVAGRGQTIGQKLMNISVINDSEHVPSFGEAFLRASLQFSTALSAGLGAMLVIGKGRQTLHDRLSGTFVIQGVVAEHEHEI